MSGYHPCLAIKWVKIPRAGIKAMYVSFDQSCFPRIRKLLRQASSVGFPYRTFGYGVELRPHLDLYWFRRCNAVM